MSQRKLSVKWRNTELEQKNEVESWGNKIAWRSRCLKSHDSAENVDWDFCCRGDESSVKEYWIWMSRLINNSVSEYQETYGSKKLINFCQSAPQLESCWLRPSWKNSNQYKLRNLKLNIEISLKCGFRACGFQQKETHRHLLSNFYTSREFVAESLIEEVKAKTFETSLIVERHKYR